MAITILASVTVLVVTNVWHAIQYYSKESRVTRLEDEISQAHKELTSMR